MAPISSVISSAFYVLLMMCLMGLHAAAASVPTGPGLVLQLFNDTSCAVPSTVSISSPIAAADLSICNPATSALLQEGYFSYEALCGVSDNNVTFAFLRLWSSSTTGSTSCSTTNSFVTYVSPSDSSFTHNATSCVPVTVTLFANGTNFVGSTSQFAQFDCTVYTDHNAAMHVSPGGLHLIVLMVLCAALSLLFIA